MQIVFSKILEMSIITTFLIGTVILIRFLPIKTPKWTRLIMWGLVALRLIIPFRIESIFSLIPPSSEKIVNAIEIPTIELGQSQLNIPNDLTPVTTAKNISFSFVFSIIWLIGIVAFLVYLIVSYLRLKKQVNVSISIDKRHRVCDGIPTPFILGIITPKIYLPSIIDSKQLEYVIEHENTHIARGDHIWKPLAYLIAILHWFNPLVWVAYILFCKDIELACDERVIRQKDKGYKKLYSEALFICSTNQKIISACPVAFGENDVKRRIKGILHYQEPPIWLIPITIVMILALALGFLTSPITTAAQNILGSEIPVNSSSSNLSSEQLSSQTEVESKPEKNEDVQISINESSKFEICTHKYKNTIIEGDCFNEGYTHHECILCGFIYMDNFTRGKHEYGKYICDFCGMVDSNYPFNGFQAWIKEYGQESGNLYVYAENIEGKTYGVQRHSMLNDYCVLFYENATEGEFLQITFYDMNWCAVVYQHAQYYGEAEIKNRGVNSTTGIVFDNFNGNYDEHQAFVELYQSKIDGIMKTIDTKIVAKMGISLKNLGFDGY